MLYRRYAAVVGNPPYITAKDAVLARRYQASYVSAAGKFSLAAPFAERFFQLAVDRGSVGMITANSFMKREFGKKLVHEFLPTVNLELIANTSGAYIPGHGTPTVLLFGTMEAPKGKDVLAVLAKRGEPTTPADPQNGLVWRSVADHFRDVGFENEYVSVARVERKGLEKHPWSLGGGGAAELKELLEERAATTLGDVVRSIGVDTITRASDLVELPIDVYQRQGVERASLLGQETGEEIRDWAATTAVAIPVPYDRSTWKLEPLEKYPGLERFLWPHRCWLKERWVSGGTRMSDVGLPYWAIPQLPIEKHSTALSIAFAFVATHNHFVLDRGGKVFKQSAPIIKLPETATEDDHLVLLAYLNSSTACFWMKQVFFPKYGAIKADHPDPARNFYEFAGTGLGNLPVPAWSDTAREALRYCSQELLVSAARRMDRIAPSALLAASRCVDDSLSELIDLSWREVDKIRRRMVFLQEEIDWVVYASVGIAPADCVDFSQDYLGGELTRGQRAFETAAARLSLVRRNGELLSAAEAEVETALPSKLSSRQEELRARRRAATDSSVHLRMMETNVFKRLWRDTEQNETEIDYRARFRTDVMRAAVLDTHEKVVAQASQPLGLGPSGAAHAKSEATPFLAAMRSSEAGLEKRAGWEATWALQRREDAGEKVGDIPVPPKYDVKDFRDPNFFRLRGKLDVPKERFISYPGCESDEDHEPVYGWAGWNHLQQMQALAALYQKRKTEEAWGADRLTPMLAGLLELLPWVKQWHNEPSEAYGGMRLGDYFEGFLDAECSALGLTRDDLRAWRPSEKKRGRAKPPAPEPLEVDPEAFLVRPALDIGFEAVSVLSAIVEAAGGRLQRRRAARALVLLYEPKLLAENAPADVKALVKKWRSRAKARGLVPDLFTAAEAHLLQDGHLKREGHGDVHSFVQEKTWSVPLHAFYLAEAKLALRVVASMAESAVWSHVEGLSPEDQAAVRAA